MIGANTEVSAAPLTAYLRGVGLWTPAFPEFSAWVAAGSPSELAVSPEHRSPSPAAELLHPRLRRRTSVLTRASVTALVAATQQAGAALDTTRFVLVSSFGEIETTVELLAQLAEPGGPVSPTKFHNSVHNTATGYMSIASGNHREATALAGGPHNLEIAALELFAGLAIDGGDAVLLVAEELLPSPFARPDGDPTFAVALHFASTPGPGLGLHAQLEPRPHEPDLDFGSSPAGLPSMVPPISALLQAIARLTQPDAAKTGIERVELASRIDPRVDQRWAVRLEHTP